MSSARCYGYLDAVCKGNRHHKEGTQATNWEKVFSTRPTDKRLVVRIYQEFLQIGEKMTNRKMFSRKMVSDMNKHFTEEKPVVHKCKRKCLTSLIIREMQIKTIVRQTANLVRMYITGNTSILMILFISA